MESVFYGFETINTNDMEKEKLEKELKNMLRLFYQSLQDYELESGNKIGHDERSSEEMVQIFIESEDAFNYESVVKNCSIPAVVGQSEQLSPNKKPKIVGDFDNNHNDSFRNTD